jgi:hypothetical protein
MNKATLIKSLIKKYPKIGIMADGNGWIPKSPDSFVISAEDGIMDHRGYDMFNYWSMRTLDDALVEQEERIVEMINEIIANHIEMIKDEQ